MMDPKLMEETVDESFDADAILLQWEQEAEQDNTDPNDWEPM